MRTVQNSSVLVNIFIIQAVCLQFLFQSNAQTSTKMMHDVVEKQILDGCRVLPTVNGTGPCGLNAYCNSSSGNGTCVDCECPPDYSFVNQEWKYLGCMSNFTIPTCAEYRSENFEFRELNNTDWPMHESYENSTAFEIDHKTCLSYCLMDCNCMVAVFGADGCRKRYPPLRFGRHGTYVNRTAYVKVPKNLEMNNNRKLLPSIGGSSLLAGLIVAAVLY